MVSANVSDEITEKSLDQVQRENEAKLLERKVSDDTKAFSPGDDYSLDNNAVEMFDLPNNTPKINMEGIPKIKSKSKVRKENDEQRYNVLVLDTSASSSFLDSSGNIFYTADTAIDYVKASAKKFIEGVQKADGTNYVAIVEYKGSTANVVSEFSTDFVSLNAAIDGLYASQNTRNVAAGLQKADTLINEISNPKAIKNVVLFTTGMTNDGEYSYDGHYNEDTIGSEWRRSDTQVRLYAYSNAAYAMAETLKSKATVYSVGLFQMMENMPEEGLEIVQFFKLFSSELATSLEHFYDVKDPNDLEFIFGEIADKVTTKDVNFYFASGEEKDYEAVCHYSDNYFRKTSCGTRQLDGYNHSLSTASLCLALSAFGSNDGGNSDYTNKYKNVEKLLTDLEFEEFDKNDWFVKKPQSDSIGVVAANKKLSIDDKECTLMAVAVRGGGYESEWAGNFTLGKSGQHYGFAQAKKQVLDFLKLYIRENKISGDIKIWLTGYSRAAATANLVAGALDDGEKLGMLPIARALEIAEEKKLDLVLVSPNAQVPVCKIMNYGKYKFEQAKKEKEAKKKQRTVEVKEVRLSPNIETNDLNTKVNNAKKFISKGNKVKVTLRFRGREMAHVQQSKHILDDFAKMLEDVAVVEKAAKLEGRNMSMVLTERR